MNRREILRGMAALPMATIVACGRNATSADPNHEGTDTFFSESDLLFVSQISQLMIPLTDTAGAIEAKVPERLNIALSRWADEEYRSFWTVGLKSLQSAFSARTGIPFGDMSIELKSETLGAIDREAFAGNIPESEFYKEFKTMVCAAYYTSEPGTTEELIYEAVPGEWRSCVPLSEIGRSWAT